MSYEDEVMAERLIFMQDLTDRVSKYAIVLILYEKYPNLCEGVEPDRTHAVVPMIIVQAVAI
jgi:dsRNA-specific ribonuclease